jgi:hypothetical protein
MSGILKRTVFFTPGDSQHGRRVRFIDWAKVITGIGTCFEPFSLERLSPGGDGVQDYENDDDIGRIDEIKGKDRDGIYIIHSEGDRALHGGFTLPRKRPF